MVRVVGNGPVDLSSIPERSHSSHSPKILQKGMNPTILPPAMGKLVGQTGHFNLGQATSLGEGKL